MPQPDDEGPGSAPAKYVPKPKRERSGVALCLSGGGYRAALFHIGALRRLNELGILGRITEISSVSGGSILSAFLATRLDPMSPGKVSDWEHRIRDPFWELTSHDIRTWPLVKRFLLPWNWFKRTTQVKTLSASYRKLISDKRLADLPDHPSHVFCATDLVFGSNWEFSKKRVGDWRAGYRKDHASWLIADAVAASSCFPPVFDPMRVPGTADDYTGRRGSSGDYDKLIQGMRLSDGGLYDNMGLEPSWKDAKVVLVSDGGAPFAFAESKGFLSLLTRYVSVASEQGASVRRRWLISNFISREMQGSYWRIQGDVASYDTSLPGAYSQALVHEVIAKIRTDLDSFKRAECAVLENHGYFLAEAAYRRHLRDVDELRPDGEAPFQAPNPDFLDEATVRHALRDSHKRLSLRRMFS